MTDVVDWDLEGYKNHPTYRECFSCKGLAELGFGSANKTAKNPEAVSYWLCRPCSENHTPAAPNKKKQYR